MVTMLLIHLAENGNWCLVGPLKEEPYRAVNHTIDILAAQEHSQI